MRLAPEARVLAPAHVASIALAPNRGCARLDDGTLRCWAVSGRVHRAPTRITLGARGVAVSSADACAVLDDATVKCWGEGGEGVLGFTGILGENAPTLVPGLDRVTDVSIGEVAACARFDDGRIACWGSALHAQIGDGTARAQPFPAAVAGAIDEAQVVVGGSHACARRHDGTVRCWGRNASGQLGDGTTTLRSTPVSVVFLGGHATQIALGEAFSCALLATGAVRCWGSNDARALGDGRADPYATTPSDVRGAQGALWIAAGGRSACAGLADGRVRCWGENTEGQLGDGTFESRSTPTDAISLAGVHGVVLSETAGCGIFAERSVRCWGAMSTPEMVTLPIDLR